MYRNDIEILISSLIRIFQVLKPEKFLPMLEIIVLK